MTRDNLTVLVREQRRSQRTITRYRKGPPKMLAALLASEVGRNLLRHWLDQAERNLLNPPETPSTAA